MGGTSPNHGGGWSSAQQEGSNRRPGEAPEQGAVRTGAGHGGGANDLKVQFVSSAGASAVSALLLTPLDVVKTRMQTGPGTAAAELAGKQGVCAFFPTYGEAAGAAGRIGEHVAAVEQACYLCGKRLSPAGVSILDGRKAWQKRPLSSTVALAGAPSRPAGQGLGPLVRDIVRYEGVLALWKGTGPALAMAVPQVGIYMTLYDRCKGELLDRGHQLSVASSFSGAAARAASTTVTSPLELVRTRLQANGAAWGHGVHAECERAARSSRGWVRIAGRALAQAGGVTALWQGLGPTLWRDVPFSAVYWLVAEETRHALRASDALGGKGGRGAAGTLEVNLAAGTVGGTVASLCTHPFDVIKTWSQTQDKGGGGATGTFALGREIAREKGVGYLWRGNLPRLLKVAPSCAIVLATYELLKVALADD